MEEVLKKHIGVIGGGPAALFLFKRLIEQNSNNISVTIFESHDELGKGMPYSSAGANKEHVTNVSSIEIPKLESSITDWLRTLPLATLKHYEIDPLTISEYKVIPRLLFGEYLRAQFDALLKKSKEIGFDTKVYLKTEVIDIRDDKKNNKTVVILKNGTEYTFDIMVACTGHVWPRSHEGTIEGYYDSPYPPDKLNKHFNHPIAIRGSSLTAIDAIRTLAYNNGQFLAVSSGNLSFTPNHDSKNFKIIMHSREGFLPTIRFHLEDPTLAKTSLLSEGELTVHRNQNAGFISIDYLFEYDFKVLFKEKEPDFYAFIQDMNMEEFVEAMMRERELSDPFSYFKKEYQEALESIRNKESIYWKEKLTILSMAMNRPAKYFSAEDRLRLQKTLMPLVSLVIASVPQRSCQELIALHEAGCLELVALGSNSNIEPQPNGGILYHYGDEAEKNENVYFKTFIDCIGQQHLSFDDFPFASLKQQDAVSPARLDFRSKEEARRLLSKGEKNILCDANGFFHLQVPGVAISDEFQAQDSQGNFSDRIFVMAVPLIGGYNPDYSGLDFCEEASKRVADQIFKKDLDQP